MPHDGIPRNGRIYGAGAPGRNAALVLALVFFVAALAIAVAAGFFAIIVPAFAIILLGYGLYLLVVASRRRARGAVDWGRIATTEDERAARRRSRLRHR